MSNPNSTPTNSSQLHEVERLIKQLDNTVRSRKKAAAEKLTKITVYPTLVSESGVFLNTIMTPILYHFGNDTENVRENVVICATNYVNQLNKTNLIDTLTYVLPPLFARLRENVEPAEHIRLLLMKLLLTLLDQVGPDSYPSTWDEFIPPMEETLKVSFKAQDPEMKLISCKVLCAMIKKSSDPALAPLGAPLSKALLPNCVHHQKEIRKNVLYALSKLLVHTGYSEEIEKVYEVIQRLTDDRSLPVRKEVIAFCRRMLVKHPMRHVMYHPLMLPLFFYLAPLIPRRPIYSDVEIEQDKVTDEATLAFDAAVAIGKQHEEDKEKDMQIELQYFDGEEFDKNGRTIPRGLTHIVQDLFPKWMNQLLPMLSDWTAPKRKYAYATMRSVLHTAFGYSTRYIPQITHAVAISLRDFKEEAKDSLQVVAVLASNVSASDIITVLLPHLTPDGPRQVLMILATTTLNDNPNDGELGTILQGLQEANCSEAIESADSLVQLLLSMIHRSEEFVLVNAVSILNMAFKISEKTNALEYFKKAFKVPFSQMIADHLEQLLNTYEATPVYLRNLLTEAPSENVLLNQEAVSRAFLKTYQRNPTEITILISDLARKNCFQHLPLSFAKEVVKPTKEAMIMIKELLITNGFDTNLVKASEDLILDAILQSMKSEDEQERLEAIEAMKVFESKNEISSTKFADAFVCLLDRLKENNPQIRITASIIIASLIIKHQDEESLINEKLPEIVLSIDDKSEEIRNAVKELIINVAKAEKFKSVLLEILKKQQNYHQEAEELCKQIISVLE